MCWPVRFKCDSLEISTTVMEALACSTVRVRFELGSWFQIPFPTVDLRCKAAAQGRCRLSCVLSTGMETRLGEPHLLHGEGGESIHSFIAD